MQVCNSPYILNFGTENVIFIEMKHGNITGPRHAPSKSNTEILAFQLTAGMLESLSEPSRSACRLSSALPLCHVRAGYRANCFLNQDGREEYIAVNARLSSGHLAA